MCRFLVIVSLLLALSSGLWGQSSFPQGFRLYPATLNSKSEELNQAPSNPPSNEQGPILLLTQDQFIGILQQAVDQAVSQSIAVVRKEDEAVLFWNRVGFFGGGIVVGTLLTLWAVRR